MIPKCDGPYDFFNVDPCSSAMRDNEYQIYHLTLKVSLQAGKDRRGTYISPAKSLVEWNLLGHEECHCLVQRWGLILDVCLKIQVGDAESDLKTKLGLQKLGNVMCVALEMATMHVAPKGKQNAQE